MEQSQSLCCILGWAGHYVAWTQVLSCLGRAHTKTCFSSQGPFGAAWWEAVIPFPRGVPEMVRDTAQSMIDAGWIQPKLKAKV